MQGLHHPHHIQQQQLSALLSAAAGDASSAAAAPGDAPAEESRLSALNSLHRAILYPPNSFFLSHSAAFLSQCLSQLLNDKSVAVRRAAAVAYGSLCGIIGSVPVPSTGIPNGLFDRFISWALPLLTNSVSPGNGSVAAELSLEGLREFLAVGNSGSIERYVPSILKASQELLEDERTSLGLLCQLLGVLTMISFKFGSCFRIHFADIVDVLLGWVFMPNIPDPDRRAIMDSFLQLRSHWLNDLQFSLGLLSKFLGDMDVLIQDGKLGRLLVLFSCFSTVLQVLSSGALEMNAVEKISEPIEGISPPLLRCILNLGNKFGWSVWVEESWKCVILLAEVLQEKFSAYYPMALDIFFQSMRVLPSSRLNGVLKANLQLISLQKTKLSPISVSALLHSVSPFSALRLHPNHLVVAIVASTYLFLLRHGSEVVISQATRLLMEELKMLRRMLEETHRNGAVLHGHSELEVVSLISFDLQVLLNCRVVAAGSLSDDGVDRSKVDQPSNESSPYERSVELSSFILENFYPFEYPVEDFLELQVHIMRALHKLCKAELLSKHALLRNSLVSVAGDLHGNISRSLEDGNGNQMLVAEYLKKHTTCLLKALHFSSPLTVKVEALSWITTFCSVSVAMVGDCAAFRYDSILETSINNGLLMSVLQLAYDREISVRIDVASVIQNLLQAWLVQQGNYHAISVVALDKLGDPCSSVKNAFLRLLSVVLPMTVYLFGLKEDVHCLPMNENTKTCANMFLAWKHVLAFKQFTQKLNAQQLVSVLSYISQKWKVPLSSWIHRLVSSKTGFSARHCYDIGDSTEDGVLIEANLEQSSLDMVFPLNDLAAVWWSIHAAARQCVNLRLRTNLGGPTQTFAALERMLLDIPNILLLDIEHGDGTFGVGSSNFHLLPMRLLLDFIEALKKHVFNAYDGSIGLPCATRQSSLFFLANKKVCEEWFSRMCEPMMVAGLAIHCHDVVMHYCGLRLQDLRNLASTLLDQPRGEQPSENLHNVRAQVAGDVLRILQHAALALCRSREPESLDGLHRWAAMAFPTLFIQETHSNNLGISVGDQQLSWMFGLIYQAQGQYEKAAAYFSHLLQSENALSYMGADGIQFVIARIIECYTSLSDWKSLDTWLVELQNLRAMHAGRVHSGALTAAGNDINAVHALACYDEGDFKASWGYLDLTPKSSNELTLEPKVALDKSEMMLLKSMLLRAEGADKVPESLEKAKLMLDEAISVAPLEGFPEAAASAFQLHCILAFEGNYKGNELNEDKQFTPLTQSVYQMLNSPVSIINQDCSSWIKVFRVYRSILPDSFATLLLSQRLHNLARKHGNYLLANRMSCFFRNHSLINSGRKDVEMVIGNLHYDSILLKFSEGKHEEALSSLWSLLRANMVPNSSFASDRNAFLVAKAWLKLSKWLRKDYMNIHLSRILHTLCEDFNKCFEYGVPYLRSSVFSSNEGKSPETRLSFIIEELIGTATKLSCNFCPTMGKAWLSYASWCFSQARGPSLSIGAILESCALSPILDQEVSKDQFQLTEEEMAQIKSTVRKILNEENSGQNSNLDERRSISTENHNNEAYVSSLVRQVSLIFQAAAGGISDEITDASCPSTALSSQLHRLFQGMVVKGSEYFSFVDELVDIWWLLRKRRVSLFGHAAHGYFQYLSNSSSKNSGNLWASSHPVVLEGQARCCTLRAMLYLMHILLNYGVELNEVLDRGFKTVPSLTWQEITPQLFARLGSHPRQAIRKHIEGLLMLLAKQSPWSIVYPALVDKKACDGEPADELQRLLNYLDKLYPKLVQDVQLMISELGSITVLWEEQWLSTFQELRTDVIRRVNMLKDEAARIYLNTTLNYSEKNKINAAKYTALMAPVVVALERRLASTSREPETAHELWFQKEYGRKLKSALLAFKTPPRSSADLGDVWRSFDAIEASLATCHRKLSISLNDVAPRLASLSSSDVPMPGFEKQRSMPMFSGSYIPDTHDILTISSFSEKMAILPTKTKPKKLVLLGSDGQSYTYLLKGREDLRLDARIMQLLQAINNFLRSNSSTYRRSLAIRHYTVTPISGRAGLIQWVDNVTSIYSIFKSWQNRSRLAQVSSVGGDGNTSNKVTPVPNPSDMFYGKIIPALKEKGIRRVISRRDWPLEVKRKVLIDLMQETPRQLLWQELWCTSDGFKSFDSKSKRFSGSVAAMSMVGFVLGLGDRHLDNILIDLFRGDVVHIDYNVCFDKGRRLKIPEIVPFRLTQTIEAALGFTGREGAFRAHCEAVINVLQKNKDIILMLLEVFSWDPLVEWTRGDIHDEASIGGEEKKGMELAVSLSLFYSRVQEIRVPLQEHHDLLLTTLPAAESVLKRFLMILEKHEVVYATYQLTEKERSRLFHREVSVKSLATEAANLLEKARSSLEVQAHEFRQAKAVAVEKAQESALWVDQHGRVIDALRSGSIPDGQFCLESQCPEEALSLISAVHISGVPLTIVPDPTLAQCYELDREVSLLISELAVVFCSSKETLLEYTLALQRVLPLNYVTMSPLNGWAQLMQLSVNKPSADVLAFSRTQAAGLVAKAQGNGFDSIQLQHRDLLHQMESYIVEINKITSDCSELMNSVGSDTEMKSKDHLMSSFATYMNSIEYISKEEDDTSAARIPVGQSMKYGLMDFKVHEDLGDKKLMLLSVLHDAVSNIYDGVKGKVLSITSNFPGKVGWNAEDDGTQLVSIAYRDFEEQIEKCVLLEDVINEVKELLHIDIPEILATKKNMKCTFDRSWASALQACWCAVKHLIEQITGVVLQEVISSIVSCRADIMEAFGSLCQIRGSIDTGLEQLMEVEIEKSSLAELEKNYFLKVGRITEQKASLEGASVQGRDHLTWEEAEELASQVEVCRAQLDQLHQTWNERDARSYSLIKTEANIKNSLSSIQRYFSSLVTIEQESDLHTRKSKVLIADLDKLFSELETYDQILAEGSPYPFVNAPVINVVEVFSSGASPSELIWRFPGFWDSHSFFIWKVGVMDSVLDLCIHNVSTAIDQNLGFVHIRDLLKKKLEIHLRSHFCSYIKERLSSAFIIQLDKQNEKLQQIIGSEMDIVLASRDTAIRNVQFILEEYCNAHETARAARSAVSFMKKQINDLSENLCEKVQEIVRMEWLHDLKLPHILKAKFLSQNIPCHEKLSPAVLSLCRPKLLERMKSSISSLSGIVESLQACERTSVTVEGQLERAMGWACAGPSIAAASSSSFKNAGIPSEFHEHLLRRKQLLRTAQQQTSSIIEICTYVLEFESSRDGIFHNAEKSSGRSSDGRSWQQVYSSTLAKLEVAYHSFTSAEQDWKLAQSSMESAVTDLYSVTSELHAATSKAKSASGDLQNTLVALYKSAHDSSAALSSFGHVSRGHTALTSECGSMLEEVLAITESLHDLYILGKEASAAHRALVENLSKVNMILLPLESSLSTDVPAMADAFSRERKNNAEISPIHGQALHKSYCIRLREASLTLESLVPSLTYSTKELHTLLTKLARDSSLHAGNLHKALEGVGESQALRSQELSLSRSEMSNNRELFNREEVLLEENTTKTDYCVPDGLLFDDEEWISPPEFEYTSSMDSVVTSAEASASESFVQEGKKLPDNNTEKDGHLHSPLIADLEKSESQTIFSCGVSSSAIPLEPDINNNMNDLAKYIERIGINASATATGEPSNAKGSVKSSPGDTPLADNPGPASSASENIGGIKPVEDEFGTCVNSENRLFKGRNAYALSVLRQVELKLQGRDNEDTRPFGIAEQVDHLLTQATNIDNLCNMYEGWTPWI